MVIQLRYPPVMIPQVLANRAKLECGFQKKEVLESIVSHRKLLILLDDVLKLAMQIGQKVVRNKMELAQSLLKSRKLQGKIKIENSFFLSSAKSAQPPEG